MRHAQSRVGGDVRGRDAEGGCRPRRPAAARDLRRLVAVDEGFERSPPTLDAKVARGGGEIRRAQQPVKRRAGKPVMFRSQPIQRKKKVAEDDGNKIDEEDDINFYLGQA